MLTMDVINAVGAVIKIISELDSADNLFMRHNFRCVERFKIFLVCKDERERFRAHNAVLKLIPGSQIKKKLRAYN